MQTIVKEKLWKNGISLSRLREIDRRATEDDARFCPAPVVPIKPQSNGGNPRRGVRIGDREFVSMRDAMAELGMSSAAMCAALRRGYVVLRVKVDATYLYEPDGGA